MIVDPDRYIDRCKEFGADIVTVHFEACRHLHRTVAAIKAAGMKAGVSLNPHVPVSVLEEILPYVDLVLIKERDNRAQIFSNRIFKIENGHYHRKTSTFQRLSHDFPTLAGFSHQYYFTSVLKRSKASRK
jgi:pentose-5-phosphate-3-epimerase